MRKWQVTLLVTVLLAVLGMVGAGWSLRPVIDYYMDGVDDTVNFQWGPLKVSLKFRNRGEVDSSLLLLVAVRNANISVDKIEPWMTYNETQVIFRVNARSRMEAYRSYDVNIRPVGDPQNFTITYTIEDVSGSSISGIISRLFLEPHPYFATYALYNKTDATTYELLK